MSARWRHRLNLFSDRDVLHVAAVALSACVLSAGLVYLGYFAHVLRVARSAPVQPVAGGRVLLFGKHAPGGRPDTDFQARIERALVLARDPAASGFVLLGGGPDGVPTEAALARDALLAGGVDAQALLLEDASRDTLQNLRHARQVLAEAGADGPVVLLSNRYHLARCAWLAKRLGFDACPCAAEPRLDWNLRTLRALAGEAAYVGLSDIGWRWARLIGSRRMLDRVS